VIFAEDLCKTTFKEHQKNIAPDFTKVFIHQSKSVIMKNASFLLATLVTCLLMAYSPVLSAQKAGAPWTIPAKYKAMKNTVKPTDASVMTTGKELYNKHCKSCHGSKGLGDGPKSATLETLVPPFNSKTFTAQADGEIYYQTFIGRDEMPNFEKKITDEGDRWALVNFIRTLK
jgi:mono/diheme cytochrome c family protein